MKNIKKIIVMLLIGLLTLSIVGCSSGDYYSTKKKDSIGKWVLDSIYLNSRAATKENIVMDLSEGEMVLTITTETEAEDSEEVKIEEEIITYPVVIDDGVMTVTKSGNVDIEYTFKYDTNTESLHFYYYEKENVETHEIYKKYTETNEAQ